MGATLLIWIVSGAAAGLALIIWALRGDPSRGRPRCPRCWYSMQDAPGLTCPECGHTARDRRALHRTRRYRRRALAGALLIALTLGGSFVAAVGWPQLLPAAFWRAAMPLIDPRARQEIAQLGFAVPAPSQLSALDRLRLAYRCGLVLDGEAALPSRSSPPTSWYETDRGVAMRVLWWTQNEKRIVRPIIDRIFHDLAAPSDERTAAMGLLISEDHELTVPTVRAIFAEGEPDAGVRRAAFQLIKFRSPHTQELIPIFMAVLDDPDPSLRRDAAQTLGWYESAGAAALPKLEDLAANDPDELVRRVAKGAAGRIRGPE